MKFNMKFIHTLWSNNILKSFHSSSKLKNVLRYKYVCKQSEFSRILCMAHTEHNSSQVKSKRLPNILESMVMASEVSEAEVKVLYNVLEDVKNDLANLSFMKETSLANNRVKKLVHYSISRGLGVGPMVLIADRFYANQRRATNQLLQNEEERLKQASILVWLVEMWMKSLAMQDDMIDGSQRRNNIPSWHTVDKTGQQAIRDSHVLTGGCLVLIKKYFKSQKYYVDLLEMFIEGIYKTDVGLSQMEIIRPSLNPLTPKSVELLKAGKRSTYCPSFPCGSVVAAMMINGATAKVPELMDSVTEIAYDTGLLVAISEDYIDGFANADVNERISTDMTEGKQSWLYWKALELASPSQAQLLLDSYGKYDADCVTTVKNIYKDLHIQEHMTKMFREMETRIENKISKLPQGHVPWNSFLFLIDFYRGVRAGIRARP